MLKKLYHRVEKSKALLYLICFLFLSSCALIMHDTYQIIFFQEEEFTLTEYTRNVKPGESFNAKFKVGLRRTDCTKTVDRYIYSSDLDKNVDYILFTNKIVKSNGIENTEIEILLPKSTPIGTYHYQAVVKYNCNMIMNLFHEKVIVRPPLPFTVSYFETRIEKTPTEIPVNP